MDIQMGYSVNLRVYCFVFVFLSSMPVFGQVVTGKIYTVANNRWNPNDTSQYYLMLKHNKTCLICYTHLYDFLKKYVRKGDTIGCISSIDSSVFARKKEVKELNKIMPGIELVLLDYINEASKTFDSNSVFYKRNIDITPALFIVKNGIWYYYPYDEIFTGTTVRKNFQPSGK